MKRVHYIAAEMFGYSYDHYQDKVSMGHIRFTKYFPDQVRQLEIAEAEKWEDYKFAKELEIEQSEIEVYKEAFAKAKRIVDADNSIESFVIGIKEAVKDAAESGLKEENDIEQLVSQILYRTADLSFLLKLGGKPLYEYSGKLRDYADGIE